MESVLDRIDHPDPTAMARAVADAVSAAIVAAIETRGRAVLAIAGGSTPAAAAALLFARPLDWARVTLMPSDERWVAADDPNSNLRGLRRWLGDTPALAARIVPLVERPGDLATDALGANARVAALEPLDLVWAGMGSDGHALSWFPGPDLATTLDPAGADSVVAVRPNPLPAQGPVPRLTITLPAVARAKTVLLTATGEAKRVLLIKPGDTPVASLLSLKPIVHWSPDNA